jgi:uncharacterized protein (DUF2147 family)
MKKLLAIAAFVLASTAAQAQYTFEYGGHTIRIDPDRGTISIPGVYDNTGRRSKRARGDQDSDKSRKQQTPQDAKADPQTPSPAPAPVEQAAPPPAAAIPPPLPEPATTTANNAPADTAVAPPPLPPLPPLPAPAPPLQQDAAPLPRPAPAPAVAAVPPPLPPTAAVVPDASAPAAIRDPNSPLGIWLTEEKEGKVRIEQCGANLCGYSVDAKSNKNGEQVLINMKPGKDSKWSGRILDPNSGSTYDSTIAMKGTDTLRVQGCAFGGMFCGGQTWTRVN